MKKAVDRKYIPRKLPLIWRIHFIALNIFNTLVFILAFLAICSENIKFTLLSIPCLLWLGMVSYFNQL